MGLGQLVESFSPEAVHYRRVRVPSLDGRVVRTSGPCSSEAQHNTQSASSRPTARVWATSNGWCFVLLILKCGWLTLIIPKIEQMLAM